VAEGWRDASNGGTMTVMEGGDTVTQDRDLSENLARAALTLARRFAGGATMWCVAPTWPSHGRHVAVEFVHPVIVGKRALPAMSVDGPEAEGSLRLLARPGDILLVASTADDVGALDLLTRSEAWGLTRVWLGAGPRPTGSRADHVIWTVGTDPALAARSGDLVLLYHLLWELTHVVFEHPGLLKEDDGCTDEVCITCSDEGRVAEVRAVLSDGNVDVMVGGRPETVDASLVDPVVAGDLLLVHAGVALTTLGATRP
jgi:hydrogenase maturation factor